jgi:5-methylcytosine-specific restriction endonuclease McrA
MFQKKCNTCDSILIYKTRYSYNRSLKTNAHCRQCAQKIADFKGCKRGPKKTFTDLEIIKRKMAQSRASRGERSFELKHDWKIIYDVIFNSKPNCYYCNIDLDLYGNKSFELDHKTSPKRGGSADKENLCITCEECNSLKGMMTEKEFFICLSEMQWHRDNPKK